MALETFPPRTRLACCATCEHWTLRRTRAWCPVLDQSLDGHDLTAHGCDEWRREPRESYAVALYDELANGGAT